MGLLSLTRPPIPRPATEGSPIRFIGIDYGSGDMHSEVFVTRMPDGRPRIDRIEITTTPESGVVELRPEDWRIVEPASE